MSIKLFDYALDLALHLLGVLPFLGDALTNGLVMGSGITLLDQRDIVLLLRSRAVLGHNLRRMRQLHYTKAQMDNYDPGY
jgi:hypothetical protein